MKPAFEDMSLQIPAATAEPEDYTGEDGLLYCGKCRTPKEAYFPADKVALFGRDRHPAECDCQRAQRMEREAAEQQRKHRDKVEELKRLGFTDPAMREWTFANDNGRNPQMKTARFYVELSSMTLPPALRAGTNIFPSSAAIRCLFLMILEWSVEQSTA